MIGAGGVHDDTLQRPICTDEIRFGSAGIVENEVLLALRVPAGAHVAARYP